MVSMLGVWRMRTGRGVPVPVSTRTHITQIVPIRPGTTGCTRRSVPTGCAIPGLYGWANGSASSVRRVIYDSGDSYSLIKTHDDNGQCKATPRDVGQERPAGGDFSIPVRGWSNLGCHPCGRSGKMVSRDTHRSEAWQTT